ncbi:MAG: hypothetical protein HC915_18855 [Anaerolineae bacterium]|nr:hypothetical protein [Anaerolineae bacterium]
MADNNRATRSTNSTVLLALALVTVVLPLLLLLLLYLTDLNMPLGRALGMNLPEDDQLRVYDVTCWANGADTRLTITYWSADAGPMLVRFAGQETGLMSARAGINSLDVVVLEDPDACPAAITLVDRSRNRRAGGAVQRIDRP